jgi:hypothetical protein
LQELRERLRGCDNYLGLLKISWLDLPSIVTGSVERNLYIITGRVQRM